MPESSLTFPAFWKKYSWHKIVTKRSGNLVIATITIFSSIGYL